MTTNRQSLADIPLETKGAWWTLASAVRYWTRKAAFAVPFVRKTFEASPLSAGAAAQHWDTMMSQTHFETYLGGTINVDSCNAMTGMFIKYRAPPNPSILDVGCCGGTLLNFLPNYDRYFGTDISKHAIEIAKSDSDLQQHMHRASFRVVDIRDFHSSEKWDVIVFNEVLYYLTCDRAFAEVDRYAKEYLSDSGILIVSMKDDAKSQVIFRHLFKYYKWIDGMLWQRKATSPDFSIRINRERPATLLGVFKR